MLESNHERTNVEKLFFCGEKKLKFGIHKLFETKRKKN